MKKCPECGKEMNEESTFCSNCGFVFEKIPATTVNNAESSTAKSQKTLKIVLCCFAIILSIFMIVRGFMFLGQADSISFHGANKTVQTSYSYYGGDAYTGMQHASADASTNAMVAAQNTYAMGVAQEAFYVLVVKILAWSMMIAGGLSTTGFGITLAKVLEN